LPFFCSSATLSPTPSQFTVLWSSEPHAKRRLPFVSDASKSVWGRPSGQPSLRWPGLSDI
jgi:hypothetical protein